MEQNFLDNFVIIYYFNFREIFIDKVPKNFWQYIIYTAKKK